MPPRGVGVDMIFDAQQGGLFCQIKRWRLGHVVYGRRSRGQGQLSCGKGKAV